MVNIKFACKEIPIMQILKCSFNLNTTEVEVLKYLFSTEEEQEVSEIMKHVKKDRTTIQRAVMDLTKQDLVKRRQMNLEKGGYVFVYSPKDKEKVKERIYQIFDSFKKKVENEIEDW